MHEYYMSYLHYHIRSREEQNIWSGITKVIYTSLLFFSARVMHACLLLITLH